MSTSDHRTVSPGQRPSAVFENSTLGASEDFEDSTFGDASTPVTQEDLSGRMGQAFVNARKLTQEEVTKIIQLQRRSRVRFGEAAIRLGLLTEDDVHEVLSQQFNYQTVTRHGTGSRKKISDKLLIAHSPYSPQAEAIRRLRSETLLRLGEQRCIALALVSPGIGEGKSHLTASLAIAFAQLNMQTLVIDANLRKPTQHLLFDISNKSGLSTMLAGRTVPTLDLTHAIVPHLRVLTSGPKPPNPSEILNAPALAELIDRFAQETQVILVDTPPATIGPDAQIIAQQVGRAILICREDQTRLSDLRSAHQAMETASVQVLGSFYNRVDSAEVESVGLLRRILGRRGVPTRKPS